MATTPTSGCGCGPCPDGTPERFKVSISGVTDNTCTECDDFNGDYYLDFDPEFPSCCWKYTLNSLCGAPFMHICFIEEGDGSRSIELRVATSSDILWKKTNIASCLESQYTLDPVDNGQLECDIDSSTVTVTPIGFTRNVASQSSWSCFPAMSPGLNPAGTCKSPFAMPYFGKAEIRGIEPVREFTQADVVAAVGGCCGGDSGCGCDGGGGSSPGSVASPST